MEYNSELSKTFNTPPQNLKSKFLKIEMLKVSTLKEFISKNNYLEVLNRSISDKRTIING